MSNSETPKTVPVFKGHTAAKAKAKPRLPETEPGKPKEIGGPKGPEPTRYGDWERKGICYDF